MKQFARRYVWWPGIDKELQWLAGECIVCVEKRPAPPRSPIHPWERTKEPWQRIHADFAGPVHGEMLLIIVDSFSK